MIRTVGYGLRPIEPGPKLDQLVTDKIVEPWTRNNEVHPWSTNWGAMHYLIDLMLLFGYAFELKMSSVFHSECHARFIGGKEDSGGFGFTAPEAVARAALTCLGHSILEPREGDET